MIVAGLLSRHHHHEVLIAQVVEGWGMDDVKRTEVAHQVAHHDAVVALVMLVLHGVVQDLWHVVKFLNLVLAAVGVGLLGLAQAGKLDLTDGGDMRPLELVVESQRVGQLAECALHGVHEFLVAVVGDSHQELALLHDPQGILLLLLEVAKGVCLDVRESPGGFLDDLALMVGDKDVELHLLEVHGDGTGLAVVRLHDHLTLRGGGRGDDHLRTGRDGGRRIFAQIFRLLAFDLGDTVDRATGDGFFVCLHDKQHQRAVVTLRLTAVLIAWHALHDDGTRYAEQIHVALAVLCRQDDLLTGCDIVRNLQFQVFLADLEVGDLIVMTAYRTLLGDGLGMVQEYIVVGLKLHDVGVILVLDKFGAAQLRGRCLGAGQ